jgi:hypothetical protein
MASFFFLHQRTWYFKHASKRGSFLEALFKGPKQNASINEAYCLGCIRHHRCVEDPPNNTDLVLKDRLKWEEAAFTAGMSNPTHNSHSHHHWPMTTSSWRIRLCPRREVCHDRTSEPCPYGSSVAKGKAAQIKGRPHLWIWPMTSQTLHQPQKNERGCFAMSRRPWSSQNWWRQHPIYFGRDRTCPWSVSTRWSLSTITMGVAKWGHKDLGLKQPWIFVIPCCAHQVSATNSFCIFTSILIQPRDNLSSATT